MTGPRSSADEEYEISLQRQFYQHEAEHYDDAYLHECAEHYVALDWLSSLIRRLEVKTLLDVGTGTGRALRYLMTELPELKALGVEPVEALRQVAIRNGVPQNSIVDGDGTRLAFDDSSFQIACEFAVLHHVKDRKKFVEEMVRVADIGVFLSDTNNYGIGSPVGRMTKQVLRLLGLWPAAVWIKTKGRGYEFDEGEGVTYSYSVFDSVPIIRKKFPNIYYLSTKPAGPNLYRTASHIALFATR
jgi:SAM-dependent methyltransferase